MRVYQDLEMNYKPKYRCLKMHSPLPHLHFSPYFHLPIFWGSTQKGKIEHNQNVKLQSMCNSLSVTLIKSTISLNIINCK